LGAWGEHNRTFPLFEPVRAHAPKTRHESERDRCKKPGEKQNSSGVARLQRAQKIANEASSDVRDRGRHSRKQVPKRAHLPAHRVLLTECCAQSVESARGEE